MHMLATALVALLCGLVTACTSSPAPPTLTPNEQRAVTDLRRSYGGCIDLAGRTTDGASFAQVSDPAAIVVTFSTGESWRVVLEGPAADMASPANGEASAMLSAATQKGGKCG
jgi:hypothetical protein